MGVHEVEAEDDCWEEVAQEEMMDMRRKASNLHSFDLTSSLHSSWSLGSSSHPSPLDQSGFSFLTETSSDDDVRRHRKEQNARGQIVPLKEHLDASSKKSDNNDNNNNR